MLVMINLIMLTGSFAITRPAFQTYFYANVSQDMLALANMIELGLGSIILFGSTKKGMIRKLTKWTVWIIYIDAVLFAIVNYFCIDHVNTRFLMMAIQDGLFITITSTAISNVINGRYEKEHLTVFNNKMKLVGSLTSFTCLSLFVALIGEVEIHLAVVIQSIVLLISAVLESIIIKFFYNIDENN